MAQVKHRHEDPAASALTHCRIHGVHATCRDAIERAKRMHFKVMEIECIASGD